MTTLSDRFDSEIRRGTRIEVVVPEGVPIALRLASVGERVYAFTIDVLWMAAAMVTISLLFMAVGVAGSMFAELLAALSLLVFFVLRTSWFIGFELRWGGRTPGKRRSGLRVVDARGAPLAPLSVVVRNLTREVELVLPIVALTNPDAMLSSGAGWVRLVSVLWIVAIASIPLVNAHRRRLGDLLAGTLVVRDPDPRLERDMAVVKDSTVRSALQPSSKAAYSFAAAQLEIYGVYELQVLEKVLRDSRYDTDTLRTVMEKIVNKTGWTPATGPRMPTDVRGFLDAFYAAQRGRLEHDLTLGRARDRKEG